MGNIISSLLTSALDIFKTKLPQDLTPEQQAQVEASLNELRKQQLDVIKKKIEYFSVDNTLIRSVRPVLTYFLAGSYNIALIYGVYSHQINYSEYLQSMGPVNSLLLGFWFGERSALKDPKKGV